MSKIAISGNATGTGVFTLASPATNTDRTLTLPDEAGTVLTSASDVAASQITSALNATGSAPIYACRAWVNFNGTGTVAIRASGNVSSITDRGVGQYTVNFSTALPDANYSVSTGIRKKDATEDGNMGVVLGSTSTTYSTSGFALTTRYFSNEGLKDAELVCATVFR